MASLVSLPLFSLAPVHAQGPSSPTGTYNWQKTNPDGAVTSSPTFSGGQWYSGYYTPLGPFPYEGGSTGDSSGQVNSYGDVQAVFTWSDTGNPADPAPSCIVMQTSRAEWDANGFNSKPPASCSDGLGDPERDSGGGETFSGISTGTQYSVKAPQSGAITLKLSGAQANIDPTGEMFGDYSSGVYWSPTVYPITITLGGAIQDSSGNYNILIGQHCAASLGGIPSNCTVSNYQWSVSGTTFQTWSADTPSFPIMVGGVQIGITGETQMLPTR